MSAVDVLAVMDESARWLAIHVPGADDASFEEMRQARASVEELMAFVEKLATPCSEPLNSLCLTKNLQGRREWMGNIRASARAALARCKGETP